MHHGVAMPAYLIVQSLLGVISVEDTFLALWTGELPQAYSRRSLITVTQMTDSDEEGDPKQESFVLPARREQDAAGVPMRDKIETEELPFRTQAALLTILGTKEQMDTPLLKAHLVNYSEVLLDRVTTHAEELPPLSGKDDESWKICA